MNQFLQNKNKPTRQFHSAAFRSNRSRGAKPIEDNRSSSFDFEKFTQEKNPKPAIQLKSDTGTQDNQVTDNVAGKSILYQPRPLIIPVSNNIYSPIQAKPIGSGIIQLVDGRLITGPSTDMRKTSGYIVGWVSDIIDLLTYGNLYDGIALVLKLVGKSDALVKAEEVIRYVQHHPELLTLAGISVVPFLASTFGVDQWITNLIFTILSRGAGADWIGDTVYSALLSGPYAYYGPYVAGALARRLGRSLINRGLVLSYSLGATAISQISRVLHGFSISGGTYAKKGEKLETASQDFGTAYNIISDVIPLERLHFQPARRGGKIHKDNAGLASAAANSMMIPNEAAGVPAYAIQSPTGVLEAMGMGHGGFLARGIRPREGFLEHILAKWGWA